MAKTPEERWKEYTREIIEKADVLAEMQSCGLRVFDGAAPNDRGWVICHAMGRPDNNPSARVNVGTGPARGRYQDFGGNHDNLSLFDFLVKWGPATISDWKIARTVLGDKYSVRKPRCDYKALPIESFRFASGPLLPPMLMMFCHAKPGITIQGCMLTGARSANYNARLPLSMQQDVFVWNMYGPNLDEADPIGYHAARVDGNKVQIHVKHRNEPNLSKTVSRGEVGFMNDFFIQHLHDAAEVTFVEGLSDMLAMQGLFGANDQHLVTSIGSASARLPQGSEYLFAGKIVNVIYDNDEPGLHGASVIASKLLPIAANVRIVKVPEPHNDIRDWILAGATIDEVLSVIAATEALKPTDPEAKVSDHEEFFRNLQADILGRTRQRGDIIIYSRYLRRFTPVDKIDTFSKNAAAMAFGAPVVEPYLVDRKEDITDPTQQMTIKDFQWKLVAAANGRTVDMTRRCGLGVWRSDDGNEFLLINGNSCDRFNGDELQPHLNATWDGKVIDLSSDDETWYQRDKLSEYLKVAAEPAWCEEVTSRLESMLQDWYWASPMYPQIMGGCIMASLMQSCWPIRPQVAVIGQTSSGKSTLAKSVLDPLFGKLGSAMSAPTEAGIRQAIRTTSKVVTIDEFDTCSNQIRILELLRNATLGGDIIKGRSDAVNPSIYKINHLFFCFGIKFPLFARADRNRFVLLELKDIPKGQVRIIPNRSQSEMGDMRHRLLSILLVKFEEILQRHRDLSSAPFVEPRTLQIYALPLAIWSVVKGWSLADTKTILDH
ncbi:MAG: hypothetical protein E6R03_12065, partial [Hyphomicrobiaceae bacterium]